MAKKPLFAVLQEVHICYFSRYAWIRWIDTCKDVPKQIVSTLVSDLNKSLQEKNGFKRFNSKVSVL